MSGRTPKSVVYKRRYGYLTVVNKVFILVEESWPPLRNTNTENLAISDKEIIVVFLVFISVEKPGHQNETIAKKTWQYWSRKLTVVFSVFVLV